MPVLEGTPDFVATLRDALADDYVIEKEIGRGGMALVYLVRDLRQNRPVAMKVLRPEFSATLMAQRFFDEIRHTSKLQHPGILPIHESGKAADLFYYTMPYVPGNSLRQRLLKERQLSLQEVVRLTSELAAALDYAHAQGIVHRDIKPENILLSDGHPLIADFGIAKAVGDAGGERLTSSGLILGTPEYMSPEQCTKSGTVDGRSDLYSLACVVYEMLAGEPPFTGPTAQVVISRQLSEAPRSLRVVRDTIPEHMEAAIRVALAKVPADRFTDAREFAVEMSTGSRESAPAPRWPIRPWLVAIASVTGVAAVLVGLASTLVNSTGDSLDPYLVAVAPFAAPDERLGLWREGMVDLLSRNLDGAGSIRTVSPTVIVHRWTGRSDQSSAERLGRATGAGLAVVGNVVPSGLDSVRASATVYDVEARRVLGEVAHRDAVDRMDLVVDSLTLGLLREIGRTRTIGAARLGSLGSSSVAAVKAFLTGEQHFRKTEFDSASASYARAIQIDTAFALPLHRLFSVRVWQEGGIDPTAKTYGLRAGALNRGLSPRESLRVATDSLLAAVSPSSGFSTDTAFWLNTRRILATAGDAARRYPEDPEAWYVLAMARYSYGHALKIYSADVLEAAEHSIALDSAFTPAYLYAVLVSGRLGDDAGARRYAAAYLARQPKGYQADGIRLYLQLLGTNSTDHRTELVRNAQTNVLFAAYNKLAWSADPDELGVVIMRELHARSSNIGPADSIQARFGLAFALAWRGHLREAHSVVGNQPSNLFGALALLGGVPDDSARRVFESVLAQALWPPTSLPASLPWFAKHGDVTRLNRVISRSDSLQSNARHGIAREYGKRLGESAKAYLSLSRGDTADAIKRLKALPDTACPMCFFERSALGSLATRLDRADARVILSRELAGQAAQNNPLFVLWNLERARLFERTGELERSLRLFTFVERVWKNADPEVQTFVREAREAVKRLTP